MAINVAKEIAALRSMTVKQLREKYREVFGEVTRAGNKDFLFKRIIWRMQSLEEGDLSERARRRAEEIANDADIRTTMPKPLKTSGCGEVRTVPTASARGDRRVPIPGTVLTRAYRGKAHHVTVLPGGFDYDGTVYRTLTAVAKQITGSHWNGFVFFGLTKREGRGAAKHA